MNTPAQIQRRATQLILGCSAIILVLIAMARIAESTRIENFSEGYKLGWEARGIGG